MNRTSRNALSTEEVEPGIGNLHCAAIQNTAYRKVLWTGAYLQVTVMSIPPCGEVGLEMHSKLDQFLRVEEGFALVRMGKEQAALTRQQKVGRNDGILIPAGTWHNIVNVGPMPLKLSSVYAPPEHPDGAEQETGTPW